MCRETKKYYVETIVCLVAFAADSLRPIHRMGRPNTGFGGRTSHPGCLDGDQYRPDHIYLKSGDSIRVLRSRASS